MRRAAGTVFLPLKGSWAREALFLQLGQHIALINEVEGDGTFSALVREYTTWFFWRWL